MVLAPNAVRAIAINEWLTHDFVSTQGEEFNHGELVAHCRTKNRGGGLRMVSRQVRLNPDYMWSKSMVTMFWVG